MDSILNDCCKICVELCCCDNCKCNFCKCNFDSFCSGCYDCDLVECEIYYINPYTEKQKKTKKQNKKVSCECFTCFSNPTKIKIGEWGCFDIMAEPYYFAPDRINKWQSDLCDNSNFLSYYCLQFNQFNRAKYDSNTIDYCCFLISLIDCIPPFCCGSLCVNFATRNILRKKYNITYQSEGTNECFDLLKTYFCCCCIVQQHEFFLMSVERQFLFEPRIIKM
jgi:hypothetical protein